MEFALIASLALNVAGIVAAFAAAILAIKLADARLERDLRSAERDGLQLLLSAHRADAERGRKAREQAAAALAKAQQANRERNAAKAKG